MNKLYLQTYGCQMNVADSEYIASILLSTGNFEITKDITKANIVIVNTCSVRQHAEDRAMSFLGKLKKLKMENEKLFVIVIGCFAQRAKFELQKNFPFIDLVVGPLEYEFLPEMLQQKLNIVVPKEKKHLNLFNKVSVFVPIMTGCNNFCSYCIVPYVRGKEISRPTTEILQEIKVLLDNGVAEVVLIGQNVNSYQYNNTNFHQLLEKVATFYPQKKYWIRFLTNHPKDMNLEIIKVIKRHSNIARHIHLPLQSGSDRILQLMNRNYTLEKYKQIVNMIRQEIPEISITTDLIVGFPTETEQDFQATVAAVKEIKFDSAFVFKYSPRKGTKAQQFNDDVPKEVKEKRHYELLTLCDTIAQQKNLQYLNSQQEVLIVAQKNKHTYLGKTLTNKTVEIIAKNHLSISLNQFVKIKFSKVKGHSFVGIVEESKAKS